MDLNKSQKNGTFTQANYNKTQVTLSRAKLGHFLATNLICRVQPDHICPQKITTRGIQEGMFSVETDQAIH